MRPLDDHLVGVREPLGGGEHRAGVAHGHVVAEELADPGHRAGEVDRAEDQHERRRGVRLDEHGQLVAAALAVRAVVQEPGAPGLEHAPDVVRRPRARAAASRARRRPGPARPPAWRPSRPGPSTIVATATGSRRSIEAITSGSCGQVCSDTASTNTSRIPPQVSPTANASSSLTPYRCSTGRPLAMTSWAEVVDRALDAAAAHAADRLAGRRHGHRRPRRAGRGLPGPHDGGQPEAAALLVQPTDVGDHLTHRRTLSGRSAHPAARTRPGCAPRRSRQPTAAPWPSPR